MLLIRLRRKRCSFYTREPTIHLADIVNQYQDSRSLSVEHCGTELDGSKG